MKYKLTPTIFFNHCFNKRRFNSFLHWFLKKGHNGHYRLLQFLEKIKLIGFHSATEAGFSISIEDLEIPESKSYVLLNAENQVFETDFHFKVGHLTALEHYQDTLEIWNRISEKLKFQVVQSFKFSDFFNPVYFMAFSGARGNISQIRQLVGMRGLMADPQGQIVDFPIRSNFREGLTLIEYLISCSGARKGIVDTALRTAASGYLTRRLVDIAHHVVISQIDCHDSRGIVIEDLYDDNQQKKILPLKQRLIGRILAETITCPSKSIIIGSKNQEISKKISQQICEIRQKVQIRSPLTCKSAKFICQFCYGWSLAEGQLVSIGEAVGILAAQSIGEPGTQLTMRTFHTGGIFTGTLLDQTYAPFTGKIHYLFSCIGLLIRTEYGKIAYLTKNSGTLQLKKNQQKKTQFVFQSGSLLYVKEGENIFQTQLIAEFPFFEKEYEFENEHEILALNSGEMYFENFILFEKTKFDFLERQTNNFFQGINKFCILSAQFFSIWGKQRNYFFKELDLADKSIPFTQVVLNYSNKYFLKQISTIPIFFKNIGYLSKSRPIFSAKFLAAGLQFCEIINFSQSYNIPVVTTPWGEISKYFISTFCNAFFIFSFQIEQKYKKINQKLFIFFINRQGISKYKIRTIFSTFANVNQTFQVNKTNFLNYLFPKNFVKNFYSNWIRQNFQVKPRLLHWKNISISQYMFVMDFLKKTFSSQYKYYFWKFQQQNQLKIGNNVYIRILIYFNKNQHWLYKKNKQEYLSSNIIQEKWCFFGHKSENIFSTHLKNFVQKKKKSKNLLFKNNDFVIFPFFKNFKKYINIKQENIFALEKFLPHSIISQRNSIKVSLIKIQQKTINFYLNTYCFFLKNFYFFKNFKVRFPNKKPSKPIQKFINFVKNIQKEYPQKILIQKNKSIHHFLKIQSNEYNKQVESISKKSLIFRKNRILKNSQEYKIRYLKSTIPEKKQYSKLFKKNFNKTFFILNYWTFTIKNRNYLYSVNRKKIAIIGPASRFFKISKNLKFLLFTKIKKILNNWGYLKKINKKQSKKNLSFSKIQIPYLQNSAESELLNILPVNFHLKFFPHYPKLQLLFEKSRNLFSKIKNINVKIIQKNFSYSLETQIFIRFFAFFENIEILDPLSKIRKDNVLFTSPENYFSHKVLSIQKKENFKAFKINGIQSRRKSCLCLSGKFYRNENFQKILGSLSRETELLNNPTGLLIAKTCNTFLFRKTTTYLLNDQSIIYKNHGAIISKNQHLYSVLFNQSKLGDIVQGIPKIEEAFEARKKSKYNFQDFSKQLLEKKKLDEQYLQNLQMSVINNIQRIYCGQGIHISDKHIEIIVRQMTSNVLILDPGETGLLHGEIVAFEWVYQMNNLKFFSNQIVYEPILLGMTKTCLETSSFLSAASFQETTRILSRAAIQNQIDFLRGLKQNVIFGKLLPIGTGYF